ncbi:hypothetical protein [Bacillus velezensis]|uniref:hypothetical protein n=1 Tax=Bacillus velezensis TaxID=492670 RepID=UPI002FBE9945
MVKLLKINKLEEMVKYEDPNTSNVHHGGKQWTRGVPIVLVTKEDRTFAINEWVYINNNGELVYNKKKNLWCQGWDWYDKGKSHIKEIFVVINK